MAGHGGVKARTHPVEVHLLDLRALARAVGEDDAAVFCSALTAVLRRDEACADRQQHLAFKGIDRALAEPVCVSDLNLRLRSP